VLCSLEVPLDAVQTALKIGAKASARTVLNPAPYPARGLPERLLEGVTVLTPNEGEFEMLMGSASPTSQQILNFLERTGLIKLLVTRGGTGVDSHFVFVREIDPNLPRNKDGFIIGLIGAVELGTHRFSAPKVTPVDTVGAGDCFNGTLAAYLAAHPYEYEDEEIRFAVAAGALKVTRQGAQAGMPRRAEILRMMTKVK